MPTEEEGKPRDGGKSSRNEVALEMMKFIAMTTGYGKGSGGTGFAGKAGKTPEEYAESLIHLFEKCREVVGKD